MALSLIPYGVTGWTQEATRRIVRDCKAEHHPVDHVWGYSSNPRSDHRNRRCVDLMVNSKADGDWILGYLRRWENQLKVRYITRLPEERCALARDRAVLRHEPAPRPRALRVRRV